nr:uncharacterized protein LOC111503073 isoform X3 [Leptinotarsa decemlineata]
MEATWTIVEFIEENSVEAVPTTWLLGSHKCYWPPFPKEKLVSSIRKNEGPNTCWPLHDIVRFGDATYDDYLLARTKTKKAEIYSELNSDTDEETYFSPKLPQPPKIHNKELPSSLIPEANTSAAANTTDGINSSCCCCAEHKLGDSLKHLLKQQILTRHILNEVLEEVKQLKLEFNANNQREASTDVQSIFVSFKHFPIDSEDKLNQLEEYLNEPDAFKAAVTEISKLGGCSLHVK